jgi:L-fucose dehydrogenase
VIVTGGAKGIGAAIARALAQERAVPVILDRDTAAAESLRTELRRYGSVSHFIEIDLCSAARCPAAIERTLTIANRLNALVNNDGVNDGVGLEKGGPEEFAASLGRNLLHYYNMAHYALPSRKAALGAIVNIASKVAFTGQGGTSGYAASKGAILALDPGVGRGVIAQWRPRQDDCPGGSHDAPLPAMARHFSKHRRKAGCYPCEDPAG